MTVEPSDSRAFFGVDAKTINDAQVEQVLAERAAEWAVGYKLEFTEGDPLSCILGFASQEAAERAAARLPLKVAPYSGPRTVLGAVLFACPTTALEGS